MTKNKQTNKQKTRIHTQIIACFLACFFFFFSERKQNWQVCVIRWGLKHEKQTKKENIKAAQMLNCRWESDNKKERTVRRKRGKMLAEFL